MQRLPLMLKDNINFALQIFKLSLLDFAALLGAELFPGWFLLSGIVTEEFVNFNIILALITS